MATMSWKSGTYITSARLPLKPTGENYHGLENIGYTQLRVRVPYNQQLDGQFNTTLSFQLVAWLGGWI